MFERFSHLLYVASLAFPLSVASSTAHDVRDRYWFGSSSPFFYPSLLHFLHQAKSSVLFGGSAPAGGVTFGSHA
jgi:hypothetical protein